MTHLPKFIFLPLLFVIIQSNAQEEWSLQGCIDHAFQHNIQIKQSALNVEISEINKEQSFGSFLPSLNGSASHGYNWGQTIDPFTNSFATERIQSNSFGLSTGVILFNGFQNQNQYKQSLYNLNASLASLEKMRNDMALNIANAYLNVLFNKEFLAIAQSNLSATDQQVDRIRKMVNAGALPQGNLLEIEAQQASDHATVISTENSLLIARLTITQQLQLNGEEAANFQVSTPDLSELEQITLSADAATTVESALRNLPEIKAAEASLEAAKAGLSISKGGYSPRLSASYSYGTGYSGAAVVPVGDIQYLGDEYIGYVEGSLDPVLTPIFSYSDFETKPFLDQFNDNINQSLFFSLSIPIFNGFSTRSNVARSEISLKNQEYALELAKQQLEQDVERAFADARAAYNNYLAGEQSVRAAELAFNYAEIRYEQGASNIVDYTTARVRLDNARANLIRNKYDYLFRSKVLEFYKGNPITFR
jgi:outer membrane protein